MLAYAEFEAGLCQYCGGPSELCQSRDADRNNPRATWIYWPTTPAECAVTTAARVWADKRDPNDRRAMVPKVVRQRRGTPRPPI